MAQNSPGQTRGGASALENYVPVAERIEKFYERFPDGKILTQIVEHDREAGFVLVRAEIYRNPDDLSPAASGHAYEYKDAGYVQKSNYIEVAETSAVGRGLAFLNFETKRGIASREEMEQFARNQREESATPSGKVESAGETRPREATASTAARASSPATDENRKPMTNASATAAAPATDDQKEEILALLEDLHPGDRRAQRKTLTESSGKQSRDDLTQVEARLLIADLKKSTIP